MPTDLRIDHVVIVVADLEQGIRDYTALGFTVVRGGEHVDWGTHNALIALADGSYLELIAFRHASAEAASRKAIRRRLLAEGRPPVECRVLPWRAVGEGLADFALLPTDVQKTLDSAPARGLELLGPLPGNRTRPDGQRVAWAFGLPATTDLPFLCADVTPRDRRVPAGPSREHANGCVGIARLTVGVEDVDAAGRRYAALLDAEPGNTFRVGAADVILCRAEEDGPLSLALTTRDTSRNGRLDPSRTHGAAIDLASGSDA